MLSAHLIGLLCFTLGVCVYWPVAEMVVVKLKLSILSARDEIERVSCIGITWFVFRVWPV